MLDPQSVINRYVELQERDQIESDTMLEALVLFYKWLMVDQCIIRDVNARQVPLHPNRAQQTILAKMLVQASRGRPIRQVILKARKLGVSTFIQALLFFLCAHFTYRLAITLAHEATATREIFTISRTVANQYAAVPSDAHQHDISFDDSGSRYYCRTAGGRGVGAGGTPNYLHLSEVAKWQSQAEETDYTATNAVPDTNPDTIIVYESTARGRELFWSKWENAGKSESSYDQVFLPWYLDDRLRAFTQLSQFALDDDEATLIRQASNWGIELSLEALQWRRNKIADIGPDIFRQEYPSTPEEAVQATKGLILPGLRNCIIDRLPFNLDLIGWSDRVGGIDYGYFDATVLVAAAYVDQTFYIFDIYHRVEGIADDHTPFLHEGHTYYIDPSSVSGREELLARIRKRKLQVRIVSCPRGSSPRIGGIVKTEINQIQTLIREGRFKVLESCVERLLIEADNYLWNPRTGEPNDTRTEEAGHFDTIAAVRYMVAGTLRKEGTRGKRRRQERGVERKLVRTQQLRSV